MQASHSASSIAPGEHEPTGYRPVSSLAIAALVLGVLSGLALVSPFFYVVPLVAVAVAVTAFADVGRAGAAKAGRLAALAGLALAAGFGTQAVTSGVVTGSIAADRARAAAEIFVQAVREGRQADAEAMCGPEARTKIAALAACLGDTARLRARPGDEAGTWVVEVASAAESGCVARLVLAPALSVQQGGVIERWLVTSCEVEGSGITPSGT
jgi:hypothetical protein